MKQGRADELPSEIRGETHYGKDGKAISIRYRVVRRFEDSEHIGTTYERLAAIRAEQPREFPFRIYPVSWGDRETRFIEIEYMDQAFQTPVIFRKWKPRKEFDEPGGDIIALFPADPGTRDVYTCSSYEHVGQHGSADPYGVMQATVPAKPEEYADLKAELESYPYGYNFKIYHRLSRHFLELRRKELLHCSPQCGFDHNHDRKEPAK